MRFRSTHWKGPRLRAVVRSVRDWLDNYLEKTDHAILAPEDAPRWSGPPEDWLRRVRQGAPELLRLMEEGRRPGPSVTQQAIDNVAEEGSSLPAALRSREVPSPVLPERRVHGENSSPRHQQNQTKAPHHAYPNSTFSTGGVRPEASGDGRPMLGRAPHDAVLRSEHTNAPRFRETMPPTHWSERLRQSIKHVLPGAVTNWSGSKSSATDRNLHSNTSDFEEVSPQAETAPRPHPAASYSRPKVGRAAIEADRLKSKRPAARASSEQPASRLAAIPDIQQPAMVASELWHDFSARSSSPIPARIDSPRNQPTDNAPRTSSRDPWPTLASGRSPERDPSDPWPELPESPPHTTHEWTRFSRNAQRRSALDLEQRGGR